MRAVGTIILAFLVSGLLASAVQLGLAEWFKTGEVLIAPMFLVVAFVVAVSLVYAVVLVLARRISVVTRVAWTLAALLVVGVVGLWVAGFALSGNRLQTAMGDDLPLLLEILIPGLAAVVVQWWFVWRHLRKQGR